MLSYKALRSVVHDAELKPLLVLEGFGECAAKSVGRQNLLTAVLKLSEDTLRRQTGSEVRDRKQVQDQQQVSGMTDSHLQSTKNARVLHTLMSRELTETTPEDIEVPQNLRDKHTGKKQHGRYQTGNSFQDSIKIKSNSI